jgi:hypothetical protein
MHAYMQSLWEPPVDEDLIPLIFHKSDISLPAAPHDLLLMNLL